MVDKTSDRKLNYLINNLTHRKDSEFVKVSGECILDILSLLQELKERRAADEISTDKVRDCKKMCRNCALTEISGDDFDKCIIDGHIIKNYSDGCKKWEPDNDTLIELQTAEIIQLKQRKKAESTGKKSLSVEPLDIKGQLRLVRDKCPDVWKTRAYNQHCPDYFGMPSRKAHDEIGDIDKCVPCKDCDACWDKALEGDE